MPHFVLRNFKGLRQDVDYPELEPNYCHRLSNIDIDDPVGVLKLRDGYTEKYTDEFTDIRSAYEYYFGTPGETKLIFNDNGTLKTYTDGGSLASLTLPTGSTLQSFTNQYFGYRDHVLITTGNGSTNHILWYGYLNRVASSNTGIFGNVEEYTGYKLLRAQLISQNGTFSQVYNVCTIGGYYYFSFKNSKYIEKRDSNLQLVSRFCADGLDPNKTLVGNNATVCLAADANYIYVGTEDGLYKFDPNGWVQLAFQAISVLSGVAVLTTEDYVYAVTNGGLYKLNKSDLTVSSSDTTSFSGRDVGISTSEVFVINDSSGTPTVERRTKAAINTVTHSYATLTNARHLKVSGTSVFVTDIDAGHVKELSFSDLTLSNTYTNVNEPDAFFGTAGVFSELNGTIEEYDSTTLLYPKFISLNVQDIPGSGSLDAGTYFYKVSVEDQDGQEYTLSDPVIAQVSSGSEDVDLNILANIDQLDDYYRIAYIHVYRAYSSTVDAFAPDTNYKLNKSIDINSVNWVKDTDINIYYFNYTDNVTEALHSTVNYEARSGVGENVRPRYTNGRYITWLDKQLHLANFYHDGVTYRNRILRSPLDQPGNVPYYDYYDFDIGEGDQISGITNIYGRSVVFKTRKLGLFYNANMEKEFYPGISSINGFYVKDDNIYYISNKGLHLFDGNTVHDLTKPVRTYFDAASNLNNTALFYFDNKDRMIFSIRNDRSFILNLQHGVWTKYDSAFAFRGYIKNYANEYIAWDGTKFYILFDGATQDAEDSVSGTGTDITIDYESPLLRFSELHGEVVELLSMRHRLRKSGTLSFKLYRYETDASGKTLLETLNAGGVLGSQPAVKTHFFNGKWGDSFSIQLTGDLTIFKYHGITFEYVTSGFTNDV